MGGPNVHSYRYKKPGHTVTHTYKYKKPGTTNTHTYHYKTPGELNTHQHRYRNKKPLTGVYSIINTIYNYFAVGGRLTGIPPIGISYAAQILRCTGAKELLSQELNRTARCARHANAKVIKEHLTKKSASEID
ncbi:hypothetical protein AVEN_63381-1 [Araneus ventricosus]|uniref:Uncharacterized protein n=1 Tax=Araneus ventricosus TaxID=182803 RepID=A0A4Y2KYD5_ARAVE|nr:hypothetical protein AVEN_63381-1 [Araneus ventricosus]